MLYLLFQLGKERYALHTRQVIAVLPMVRVKEIPLSEEGVAGVFDYRGTPVPLLDLSKLALKKASRARMSTRIILIDYAEESGEKHLLGLLAEQVTETLRRSEEEFVASGVDVPAASYLGPVTTDSQGLIQRVEIARLLPPEVRARLFQHSEGQGR
jgi:chemotaxis-related protein WspB